MSEEQTTYKSFEEAYAEWKKQDQESFVPESLECGCGLKRLQSEDTMELDERYCDGLYQYVRKTKATIRIRQEGQWQEKAWEGPATVFVIGNCPVPAAEKTIRRVQQIKTEYRTIEGAAMEFATFDRDAQPEAFEILHEFATTGSFAGKRRLWLSGSPGTGKTHLARAAYVQLLLDMRECLWITAARLAEMFRAAMATNDDYLARAKAIDWIDRADRCDYLFIDDLGSERATASDLFSEQLKELLDSARGGRIISTNLGANDLRQRYGEKTYSRLLENSEAVQMAGSDFRKGSFPHARPPQGASK